MILKKYWKLKRKVLFYHEFFIAVIIVAFGIAGGAILLLHSSKTYQDTIESIKTDEVLKNEMGDIKGVGLFPSGTGFLDFAYKVNRDPSTFVITVRGSKIIRDVEITLYKTLPAQ